MIFTMLTRCTMKLFAIVWNLLLCGLALYGVFFRWGPGLWYQVQYQFTNPHGGSSMWGARVEMALILGSFLACIAAFSSLFNRELGPLSRLAAAVIVIVLLGAWVSSALLTKHLIFHDESPPSVGSLMMSFGDLGMLTTAVICLTFATAVGFGPLAFVGRLLRRRTARMRAV